MDRRVDMIGYSRRAATRGRQLRRCIGIVLLWLLFGGIGAAGAAALSLWLGGAVPAAWLLALAGNVSLVWWAFPISECVSAVMTAVFLIRINRKIISGI